MQNNSAPPKSSDSNVAEDWNLFGAPGFDLDSNIERIHSRSSSVSLHASDDDQGENNSFEARYKKFLNNFKKSLPSGTIFEMRKYIKKLIFYQCRNGLHSLSKLASLTISFI